MTPDQMKELEGRLTDWMNGPNEEPYRDKLIQDLYAALKSSEQAREALFEAAKLVRPMACAYALNNRVGSNMRYLDAFDAAIALSGGEKTE